MTTTEMRMTATEVLSSNARLIRALRRNELEHALDRSSIHRLKLALDRAMHRVNVEFLATGHVVFDQAAVMRKATWWFERLERIAARRKP